MKDVKKIVIIGGESTGKSTLCAMLANHFHTIWVREYAREYLEKKDENYTFEDLYIIAKGQIKSEDEKISLAHKFLFCDTDLNVIKIWSEHKYQKYHKKILQEIANRKYDAYIITSPDFAWVNDKLREHPEPEMRNYFFKLYTAIIENTKLPFCIVKGNEDERLQQSIQFIEKMFM